MKTVREYLIDLLEYIGYLESFTVQGLESLEADVKTELAVRNLYYDGCRS